MSAHQSPSISLKYDDGSQSDISKSAAPHPPLDKDCTGPKDQLPQPGSRRDQDALDKSGITQNSNPAILKRRNTRSMFTNLTPTPTPRMLKKNPFFFRQEKQETAVPAMKTPEIATPIVQDAVIAETKALVHDLGPGSTVKWRWRPWLRTQESGTSILKLFESWAEIPAV